jgi:hypothetical protein
MVGTLDFEKASALYGISQDNYVGIKHKGFRKCMKPIVNRENRKRTPIMKLYGECIYSVTSGIMGPTLLRRIPWRLVMPEVEEEIFYYFGFRYKIPQYIVPKMRVRITTLRSVNTVENGVQISVFINQYASPNFDECLVTNHLILTSFEMHYTNADLCRKIRPIHVVDEKSKMDTVAVIPFVEIPFDTLKRANLLRLIDNFEVTIYSPVGIAFSLEPVYE